ncbi:MAG: hypothetical protein ACI8QC_003603 [Planctomycetota bacterium]|jgi:hypothetical protein
MSRLLVAVLILLAAPSLALAAPQRHGLPASNGQRKSLQVLVDFSVSRASFFLSSVDPTLVDRHTRKAIFNQSAGAVTEQLEDALVGWIASDLGIRSKEGLSAIRRFKLKEFGKPLSPDEMRLAQETGLDAQSGSGEDLSDQERMRAETARVTAQRESEALRARIKTWPFDQNAILRDHAQCLRHSDATQAKLKEWLGPELNKDQVRGCKELANFYAPDLELIFGITSKDRIFRERFEEALLQHSTARALGETLVKLRRLARPKVHTMLDLDPKDPIAKLDAEEQVPKMVCKQLNERELWYELAADHKRMIDDTKAFRRILAGRK